MNGHLGPNIISTIRGQNILEDTCTQQVCALLLRYPAQKVARPDSIIILSHGGAKIFTNSAEAPCPEEENIPNYVAAKV